MNNWTEKKKIAITESDDFMDAPNRNGLSYLLYWKSLYPNFKITLFTVPDKTTMEFLDFIDFPNEWVELAPHGFTHETNFECWHWDEITTNILMKRVEDTQKYVKIFKAPGWTITGDKEGHGSGYKLEQPNLLANDNQAVYKALIKRDYIIMDRHYNKLLRPEGGKIICIDCNPDFVHMHTWNMETGDPQGRNGFEQVEYLHGVPWDENTEFLTISEAWEKGLIRECQK